MSRLRPRRPALRALIGAAAAIALLLQLVPASLAAPSGVVTGVLQVEGALTADAVAVVTIVDAGLPYTEAVLVGQQRSPVSGTGEIPFEVRYDPARIDATHPYILGAAIVDGETVHLSAVPVPVITGGPETGVVVPMVVRPAGTGLLTVFVRKADATELSPDAVVQVTVGRIGAARLLGRDVSVTPGQPPVQMAIPYDPLLADPTAQYVARASIVDGGKVWEGAVATPFTPSETWQIGIDVTAVETSLPTVPPSPGASATPGPAETPGPTAAPTAEPTAAPTAEATPTPAPTATPTATPVASGSPTPRPTSGTVDGTLVYGESAKLSADARAVVALLDEGNSSSVAVVATTEISGPGQQPIAFSLTYATADIEEDRTYTIRGAIVDGENAWVSAEGVPVITEGAPTSGVIVRLTYRPDLLLGEVTGTLTGFDGTLGESASSVTIVSRPDTGVVLGFDARPQPGATSPIAFSVPFNVTDVDPAATYVVSGQLTDGERSWESTTAPAVITNGNPLTGIEVPLVAVATPTPSPTPTPTPSPTPAATPVTPPTPEEEGVPPWLLLLAVAAVVIVGIVVIIYARRSSTPPPTTPTPSTTPPPAAAEPAAPESPVTEPPATAEPPADETAAAQPPVTEMPPAEMPPAEAPPVAESAAAQPPPAEMPPAAEPAAPEPPRDDL